MNYDVIVIGAGAGGLNIAVPCAKLGLKTLLIDKSSSRVGGECLNTGCVPSKALLHIAKRKHNAAGLTHLGVEIKEKVIFSTVLEAVREIQAEIGVHDTPEFLSRLGVEFVFGEARFVSRNTVQVGDRTYSARRIVIATGARPRIPTIHGIEQIPYLTHENLWKLNELPGAMLIVGAGPVGIEMAQAFARLGSQVTVVEKSPRVLLRDPQEASELINRHLVAEGIQFLCGGEVVSFPTSTTAEIKVSDRVVQQRFDKILIATGKELVHKHLDLVNAGIRVEGEHLKIDSYLRTTNKHVYVCGDAVGHFSLTHLAELHASVILWNLFSPIKKKLRHDHLSWVTFTDPEVATFGLSEKELQERGVRYRKVIQDFADVNRAAIERYPESNLTIFLKRDRILGGTMVAPNAGELIQELVLAMQNKIPLRKFLEKTYAYPVASRINRWLSIWEYERRTTSMVRKTLRGMFRLMH